MKLFVPQEQYQELEHGPTASTGSGSGSGAGTGTGSYSIHSASVSDSHPSVSSSMGMMQNLSSHQDSNDTTLPATNAALQPQWENQPGRTDTDRNTDSELSKKKKNIMWLWWWVFVLFVGLMIVAIVTTRVTKRKRASLRNSSSSSSSSATGSAATTNATSPSSSTTTPPVTTSDASASPWTPTVAPSSLVPSTFPTITSNTSSLPSVSVTSTPSIAPSRAPSASPSAAQSARPTTLPSILPTLDSMAPTEFTLDIPNQEELLRHLYDTQKVPPEFRIKMHYEPQYLWQDETIERRWCIECTTCPYNNFDLTNTICDIVQQCTVGNQIWIVNCDANYGQIFTIRPQLLPQIDIAMRSRVVEPLQDGENDTVTLLSNYYYHQIQIVQNASSINNGVYMNGNPSVMNLTNGTAASSLNLTNPYANQLCLERTATRYVTVQICHNYTTATATNDDDGNGNPFNASQLAQLWDPLVPYQASSMDNNKPNVANDGMTISNNTFRTFTITPGILLSSDIVMANTTTTTATNDTTTNMTTTWCLTNQHHPKSEEIVALKPCTISDYYNTGFWNIYTLPS